MRSHAILVVVLIGCASWVASAETPRKPNLVVIMMDDLGYGDISPFHRSTPNRTPELERMAREGMKLTSFYAANMCTPSRAQFLTGCYAKRVSLPVVIPPSSPLGIHPDERTIASLLKSEGYATMCVGKWHVGDQIEFLPTRRGFDRYLGLPYSNDMGGALDGSDLARGKPPLPLVRDEQVVEIIAPADQDRLTARYTDEAVAFIREHREQPFFLYLPHTGVHVPLHPGAEFRGRSKNGIFGDWVEEADASTGRILETLRELRLDSRTLVLFTSDNGPWLTKGGKGGCAGPLRGGKISTFEGGMRVPTIAWWPGTIGPATTSDAVSGLIDLLPTFVALAGGQVPAGPPIDGADLSPLLLGKASESPHEAYYFFSNNRLEAVRSGPWKLAVKGQREHLRADEPPPDDGAPPRLYHLVDDIGEKHDLAAREPEVVARLQVLVAKMAGDLGATGLGQGVRPPARSEKPVPLQKK
jgi:arylsulfatase A